MSCERQRTWSRWPLIAGALLLAITGCSRPDSEEAPVPSARVRSVLATEGALAPLATAYGVVTAAAAHTRVIVMPFEGTVAAVDVHVGDTLHADQSIVTVARTGATAVQSAQARSALNFARQDLARVQRLQAEKLATNEQLGMARKALADAQAQVDALDKVGANQERTALRAPFAGVVTLLAATPGDRPAPGTPLATVSSPSDLIVQLGVEPADAARLAPGAPVELMPSADGAGVIQARLASVGKALDPTSHLVNAVAPLPQARGAEITLGATLLARIALPEQRGILVPRSALLEDAAGPFVFTIIAGKAHRQGVQVAAETAQSALTSGGLAAGTRVIVTGNAGLREGIAVSEAKADPATAADARPPGEAEHKP